MRSFVPTTAPVGTITSSTPSIAFTAQVEQPQRRVALRSRHARRSSKYSVHGVDGDAAVRPRRGSGSRSRLVSRPGENARSSSCKTRRRSQDRIAKTISRFSPKPKQTRDKLGHCGQPDAQPRLQRDAKTSSTRSCAAFRTSKSSLKRCSDSKRISPIPSASSGINFVMPEDGYVSMADFEEQMKMLDYLHSSTPKFISRCTPENSLPASSRTKASAAIFAGPSNSATPNASATAWTSCTKKIRTS